MREDRTISTADGTALAAWLYRPGGPGPHPVVVMSHGFTALRRMGLDGYARTFRDAGLACVVYDHRNWGDSGGRPRSETDPWQQLADLRDVITWARAEPGLDPDRVGVWGTSYAGGHAIVVGALDRRVKAVVSQVPLVDGLGAYRATVAGGGEPLLARFAADRDARARGEEPATVRAAAPGTTTEAWATAVDTEHVWPNRLTLRSLELIGGYVPASFVAAVAPTPLLMIVADDDEVTPTPPQLDAFARAGEPKRLVRFACRHYDVYTTLLPQAAAAARDFLVEHLAGR